MTKLWYVGTPFSAYKDGLQSAFEMASRETALLLKSGVPVFSPIAHSFPIALHGEIDQLSHNFWMNCDAPFIELCTGLIVVMASGWAVSEGLRIEREAFHAAGKPIVWMTPGVVPPELLKK